jgi:hypothetical protein
VGGRRASVRPITAYPLLSDEGSYVMRRLGLINERVLEDHAAYGITPDPRHANLPYPGVFALDGTGVIVGRRFHESYRERDGGATLLAQLLGLPDPPPSAAPAAGNDSVRVSAWLDAPTYSFFQRLHLNVEISISPGLHLAAPPIVHVAAMPGVEVGPVEWQRPSKDVESARGVVPLTFTAAPGAGDVIVDATVTCQPMREGTHLPPVSVRVQTRIRERAMADRTLPARR